MNELIAKKYVKALTSAFDTASLQNVMEVLDALNEALADSSVSKVIYAPQVSKEQRAEIVLSAIEKADSKEVENFVKILVEKDRIALVGDIAEVLRKYIADQNKSYTGIVYSNSDIDEKVLNELGAGLGKKFDSTISLQFERSDFDGIKVDVEDLGIEISFSKSRISNQIVEHILKAI